ncbi:hypothetical protein D9M68_588290 [compost metagenome]
MVEQGDGVENALDNPELLHLEQIHAGRAPPHTLVAGPGLEARLLLAEAVGAVDQPFPVAAFLQGEAHRGRAFAQLAGPEMLLAEPALDKLQAKAPGELQVSAGGGVGLLVRGRYPVAPVVEQILVQLLHMPLLAALALAAAVHRPGRVGPAVELPLPTGRAGALAQVQRARDRLQAVIRLQALQKLAAQCIPHLLVPNARTASLATCSVRERAARAG